MKNVIKNVFRFIGACDHVIPSTILDEFKKLTNAMPKGMQLDEFLIKRSKRCLSNSEFVKQKKNIYWQLLVFEMLYLWNALPSCSIENINTIISGNPNYTKAAM